MTCATPTNDRASLLTGVTNAGLAATILRVLMGIYFLTQVWMKLMPFTPAGTVAFFESIGFPGFLAYVVIVLEGLGGIGLILGLWSRWVSIGLLPILLGSIYLHWGAGFFFSNAGSGWEFPAFWSMVLIVQAMLSHGTLSLGRDR